MLNDMKDGWQGAIISMDDQVEDAEFYREMGVMPGACVAVLRRAPFGDPVEINLNGTRLALRAKDAARIRVE